MIQGLRLAQLAVLDDEISNRRAKKLWYLRNFQRANQINSPPKISFMLENIVKTTLESIYWKKKGNRKSWRWILGSPWWYLRCIVHLLKSGEHQPLNGTKPKWVVNRSYGEGYEEAHKYSDKQVFLFTTLILSPPSPSYSDPFSDINIDLLFWTSDVNGPFTSKCYP